MCKISLHFNIDILFKITYICTAKFSLLKKFYIFICLMLLVVMAFAQNYEWAKSIGSTGQDFGNSIAIDAAGNCYVTGAFSGTADFDPGPGTASLISHGGWDIFLAKYDANGNYLWAKDIGSTTDDYGNSIAIDSIGNCYITGAFQGTTDFDPGIGSAILTSHGTWDIFFAKYDANGNYLWAKNIGGASDDRSYCIALDSVGNCYLTGFYKGSVDFDPGPGTANFTSIDNYDDIFIAKYTNSGNYLWAKTFGGAGYARGYSIVVDGAGNCLVAGSFQHTIDFDPGPGTVSLVSAGGYDIFYAKYDANGNYLWAKRIGSTADDYAKSITIDGAGNCYITGGFNGTVDFNPGAGIANLIAISGYDIFFAKYNANGNYIWAKSMGSTSEDFGNSIALDKYGNCYLSGYFQNTPDFDPGPGIANLTAVGGEDIFFAKYDVNGNYIWAKNIGGSNIDYNNSIFIDSIGYCYITGGFSNTADFDPGLGTANLTALGSQDVFLAKYGQPSLILTQPHDSSICLGTNASFNIAASGAPAVSFQWQYKNGTWNNVVNGIPAGAVYSNETTALMNVGGIVLPGTYKYRCYVTNAFGADTSNMACLIVNPYLPVSVNISSSANPVCAGTNVIFTATPTNGGASPIYQWKINSINVGTNSPIYSSSLLANNDTITCKLTSSAACVTGNPDTSNSIIINVNPSYSVNNPQSICSGSSYIFNGHSYTAAGTYNDTLTTILSCDSIIVTQLTVNPEFIYNENHGICYGDTYNWHGADYSTTGVFTDSYSSINGCDSIFTLHLTVNSIYSFIENQSICDGETFNWHGTNYNSAGIFTANYTSIYGCDSVYTMNLSVYPSYSFSENHAICNGDTFLWYGQNYYIAGTFQDAYQTVKGCDSTYTLYLVANPVYTFMENHSICNGEIYNWRGTNYSATGTYSANYTSISGCDSIYTLNLTVNPVYGYFETHSICNGDTFVWHGQNLNIAGTFHDSLQSVPGCDSIYTLNLTANPVYAFTENHNICDGETYHWQGNDYSIANTYTANYTSINGCDSIYILNLIVNPVYSFVDNFAVCYKDSLIWRGQYYDTQGTYVATYQSNEGCDSTYTLNLSINPVYHFSENDTICAGETYTWQGNNYTSSGTYNTLYTTNLLCDSTYELNLIVNSVDTSLTVSDPTITANAAGASYQWLFCATGLLVPNAPNQSFTPIANGYYACIITQNGCKDTSACITITTVGLGENDLNNNIILYPNPASNELTIENKGNKENIYFEILNSIGQVVFTGTLLEKTLVQTSTFAPGVYLIKLEKNKSPFFRKLIKE